MCNLSSGCSCLWHVRVFLRVSYQGNTVMNWHGFDTLCLDCWSLFSWSKKEEYPSSIVRAADLWLWTPTSTLTLFWCVQSVSSPEWGSSVLASQQTEAMWYMITQSLFSSASPRLSGLHLKIESPLWGEVRLLIIAALYSVWTLSSRHLLAKISLDHYSIGSHQGEFFGLRMKLKHTKRQTSEVEEFRENDSLTEANVSFWEKKIIYIFLPQHIWPEFLSFTVNR